MSTPEPVPPEPALPAPDVPGRVGMPGLVAAVMIGLQALGCAVFAVFFLFAAPRDASLSDLSHVMFSVSTVLIAAGLALVARGLWHGRNWSRTAAVVWLALLLPVGWALVQAGRGPVGAMILGSALVGIGAVAMESRLT